MKEHLLNFIEDSTFPCVMAKAVAKTGRLQVHDQYGLESQVDIKAALDNLYSFIDEFREGPEMLSSFALVLKDPAYQSFPFFEEKFWDFLLKMDQEDKLRFPHDPRVSSNPCDNNYSFSIKSEAFFILVLHPKSPRWARRFKYPAVIFNPHIQFEKLREKGIFKKLRDVIRQKDKLLQGFFNPMLSDFGERSEVFQYMGRVYKKHETVPLLS